MTGVFSAFHTCRSLKFVQYCTRVQYFTQNNCIINNANTYCQKDLAFLT